MFSVLDVKKSENFNILCAYLKHPNMT